MLTSNKLVCKYMCETMNSNSNTEY